MTHISNEVKSSKSTQAQVNSKSYKELTPEKDGIKGGLHKHWKSSDEKKAGVYLGESEFFAIDQWADGEEFKHIATCLNRKTKGTKDMAYKYIRRAIKNNIHIHKETAKIVLLILKIHLKHLQHIMDNEGGGNMRNKWFQNFLMISQIEAMFYNSQIAWSSKDIKEIKNWVEEQSTYCKDGLIGALKNDKMSMEEDGGFED